MLSGGTDVTWDTEETKLQRSRRRAEHVGSERKISKFKLGPLGADLLSAKVLEISMACFYL